MTDETRKQKRKELDELYDRSNELARETAETEARINKLLKELGDEI